MKLRSSEMNSSYLLGNFSQVNELSHIKVNRYVRAILRRLKETKFGVI